MTRPGDADHAGGRPEHVLSLLVLVAAAVVSALFSLRDYALPTLRRVWRLQSEPAIERSALFAFGSGFAEYAEFVRQHVPEGATLAIPKESQDAEWGHLGIVQYFMFPRRIIDCPPEEAEACVLRLTGESTFILAPNDLFPPRPAAGQVRIYLPFDDRRGLYVPPGAAGADP